MAEIIFEWTYIDLIILLLAPILASVASIMTIVVTVALVIRRVRTKLKFVDYHIRVDEGKITAITFTIHNKTSKPIVVYRVRCMFKSSSEMEVLIDIPSGISILPKQNEEFSHGYIPPADERAQRLTDILKKNINRLFISHNAGKDYMFRRIKDFKIKIKESGILTSG